MPRGCEIMPGGVSDPSMPQPARVEVVETADASTTFALFYDFSIENGDFALLTDARLGPDAEIAVLVPDGNNKAVIVRGPVTRQRISVQTGGDGSVLEVIGGDATIALGREVKVHVWSSVSDADVITQILSSAGLSPTVKLPSSVVHVEEKNALVQRETDLHMVRRLARRNGCWLWLDYDPSTAGATAHVERPPVGSQPAVSFHIEPDKNNVREATIEWDVERVVSADADQRDVFGASDMDGSVLKSPLTSLADHALADIIKSARRARLSTPVDDAGDLIVRSEAALIEEGWFVSVGLRADVRTLKAIVRAPSVAELNGAGSRHSGKYMVVRVAHQIDDDSHLMNVTLARNGWN